MQAEAPSDPFSAAHRLPGPIAAKRLDSINFSQTLAMGRRAAELRRLGRDVISLGLGELDLAIPQPIRTAAAEAALRGEGQSPPVQGIEALLGGIARKLARDNGLPYDPSEIIVANGTKQIIFTALMATLNPGDEVLAARSRRDTAQCDPRSALRSAGGCVLLLSGLQRLYRPTHRDGPGACKRCRSRRVSARTANVVTVPGSAFGLGPALRLSYTCPESQLDEAIDRISSSLALLR